MASMKSFIKGLMAGAVLGAVGALAMSIDKNDKRVKLLKKTVEDIMDVVGKKAVALGQLSRSAYNKIVDTTVAEYKIAANFSEDELKELSRDLKDSWTDIAKIFKNKK